MKRTLKTLLIVLAVIALLAAGAAIYRHYSSGSVMDGDGMEFDWQTDMKCTWVCTREGYEDCTVTIGDDVLVCSRGDETLYDGAYYLDENSAVLTPSDAETFGEFGYFEYTHTALLGGITDNGGNAAEIEFVKEK